MESHEAQTPQTSTTEASQGFLGKWFRHGWVPVLSNEKATAFLALYFGSMSAGTATEGGIANAAISAGLGLVAAEATIATLVTHARNKKKNQNPQTLPEN